MKHCPQCHSQVLKCMCAWDLREEHINFQASQTWALAVTLKVKEQGFFLYFKHCIKFLVIYSGNEPSYSGREVSMPFLSTVTLLLGSRSDWVQLTSILKVGKQTILIYANCFYRSLLHKICDLAMICFHSGEELHTIGVSTWKLLWTFFSGS